jgi:15-cis-phytoene synthase
MNAELGYARAEALTRARAKSFTLAAAVLDRETRKSACALYAFCRRCDDAVDSPGAFEAKQAALRQARREAEAAYAGDDLDDPILAAFGDTVRRTGVPRAAVLDLIAGMERDLALARIATWAELDAYCELAAGTVGRMMAAVLGVVRPEATNHAAALGRAMQLTNCARDVREDLVVHGRVYLPREALRAHGVRDQDLSAWAARGALDRSPAAAGFREVMRDLEDRARALYAFAAEGIPLLATARGRACVRMMAGAYAAILDALRARDFDPFAGRARVGRARTLVAACTA